MKIVRYYEFGSPDVLRVEETPIPTPAANEVLIQTIAIGVNFTDISHRSTVTTWREPPALPQTPGAEVVGTVVAKGDQVTSLSVGQSVIALVSQGGYAEYLSVPAALVFPLPSGLDPQQAVALPLQGLTAYHILTTCGRLQPGERVFIQAAAGGVGTLAVQLAKILGAGQIFAAASTSAKRDLACSLGADVGVDYSQPGWMEQVMAATGGKGVDLILDMIGGAQFSENFRYLVPFGRIVSYGAASGQRAIIDAEQLTARCCTVTGFYSAFAGTRPELVGPALRQLLTYVSSGQLKLQIHHRFPLSQAAEAHRLMESRQSTGKIVLLLS